MAEVYRQYRRRQLSEMTPWTPEIDMTGVSVSDADRKAGSPKPGDFIGRNPADHSDRWLVAAKYAAENFQETGEVCAD